VGAELLAERGHVDHGDRQVAGLELVGGHLSPLLRPLEAQHVPVEVDRAVDVLCRDDREVHACNECHGRISCTAQPLPSGSLKNTNLKPGLPGWPSSWTSPSSSPRLDSSSKAVSMSVTTIWRPFKLPGSIGAMPVPT